MRRVLLTMCIVLACITMITLAQPVFADTVELVNPIGGTEADPDGVTDIPTIVAIIITAMLGIMGSLALVAFVVGAFLWITSAGSSDKIKKGSQVMATAAIGMFVIFGAYAILSTVLNALTG